MLPQSIPVGSDARVPLPVPSLPTLKVLKSQGHGFPHPSSALHNLPWQLGVHCLSEHSVVVTKLHPPFELGTQVVVVLQLSATESQVSVVEDPPVSLRVVADDRARSKVIPLGEALLRVTLPDFPEIELVFVTCRVGLLLVTLTELSGATLNVVWNVTPLTVELLVVGEELKARTSPPAESALTGTPLELRVVCWIEVVSEELGKRLLPSYL